MQVLGSNFEGGEIFFSSAKRCKETRKRYAPRRNSRGKTCLDVILFLGPSVPSVLHIIGLPKPGDRESVGSLRRILQKTGDILKTSVVNDSKHEIFESGAMRGTVILSEAKLLKFKRRNGPSLYFFG